MIDHSWRKLKYKTKTARVRTYVGRGCSWVYTDILYRGKVVYHNDDQSLTVNQQNEKGRQWAKDNGFTHIIKELN